MTRSQLNIDHVARVEGHGNVHVVIEDDVVKTVEMNIVGPPVREHGARPPLRGDPLHLFAHLRHLFAEPLRDRP